MGPRFWSHLPGSNRRPTLYESAALPTELRWRFTDMSINHYKQQTKTYKLADMDLPKKFLHDRTVLALVTLVSVLLVIGVSLVMLRFDVSKNPTTVVAYRPNISGSAYQSGKPIDIYVMAAFMVVTAASAVILSARIYNVNRATAVFILASAAFLLILASRVAWSIISLQ